MLALSGGGWLLSVRPSVLYRSAIFITTTADLQRSAGRAQWSDSGAQQSSSFCLLEGRGWRGRGRRIPLMDSGYVL